MAHMSQEKKAQIAPVVKAILKKYGIKGTLSVRNHSTLVLNIKSGKIDFIDNSNEPSVDYISVNPYHYGSQFSGKALKFIDELLRAMNAGNHDNSDSQSDYFDVGFYVSISIGKWNKPYILTK